MTIRTTTIENGSAAMIAAICSAFNPPACNKRAAIIAIVNPHISFKLFFGDKLPLLVCIETTNVAESAEVTKNVATKINPIIVKKVENGRCEITANNPISVPFLQFHQLFQAIGTFPYELRYHQILQTKMYR